MFTDSQARVVLCVHRALTGFQGIVATGQIVNVAFGNSARYLAREGDDSPCASRLEHMPPLQMHRRFPAGPGVVAIPRSGRKLIACWHGTSGPASYRMAVDVITPSVPAKTATATN